MDDDAGGGVMYGLQVVCIDCGGSVEAGKNRCAKHLRRTSDRAVVDAEPDPRAVVDERIALAVSEWRLLHAVIPRACVSLREAIAATFRYPSHRVISVALTPKQAKITRTAMGLIQEKL